MSTYLSSRHVKRWKATFSAHLRHSAVVCINWTILLDQLTVLMVTGHGNLILVCRHHNHILHKTPPKYHVCTGSFRSNYSKNHPIPCIPETDIFASSRNVHDIFGYHDWEWIEPALLSRLHRPLARSKMLWTGGKTLLRQTELLFEIFRWRLTSWCDGNFLISSAELSFKIPLSPRLSDIQARGDLHVTSVSFVCSIQEDCHFLTNG